MGAVRLLAWSEVRRRWRGLVGLTLLVGLVGTIVLATLAGARRTDSALDRFKAASRTASAQITLGAVPSRRQLDAFGRVPQVAGFAEIDEFYVTITGAPSVDLTAAFDGNLGRVVDRPRLIAGRLASASRPDDINIGESLAGQLHKGVGDHLDASSYTPTQVKAVENGATDPGPPAGPHVRLRIVGVVRRPQDLGIKGALGGVLVATPGFAQRYAALIGGFGAALRIRTVDGGADVAPLTTAAHAIFGSSLDGVQSTGTETQGAQSAVGVLTAALWIFAAVAAVSGLVAIGIVLTRQLTAVASDQASLEALGLTRSQRIWMNAPATAFVAVGGAVLAGLGSVVASPLFPIGIARLAEPTPGIRSDWLVAPLGALGVAIIVTAIGFVGALRTTRSAFRITAGSIGHRSSTVSELASRTGLPPSASTGLRMALQPGRGTVAVPVRSAFLGSVFGVLGITALLVFGSSLHRLDTTPRLYGWTWDFSATDIISNNASCRPESFGLLSVPGISSLAAICYGSDNLELRGHPTNGWTYNPLRGSIGPAIVSGRAPAGPREVALGAKTLKTLGKHIGDTVRVAAPHARRDFRIVGQAVFPTLSQVQPIDEGATFTAAGFAPLFDQNNYYEYVVGRYRSGADRAAIARRISGVRQLAPAVGPTLPAEVDRLRQIDWTPVVLAALLAGLALVAVGHAVFVAVRRRRRDFAVLKTLGFDRRQVAAAIAWQATTLVTVGLVLGVPLGLIVGRLAWRLVAESVGVSTAASYPLVALFLLVPAGLALVNLIAFLPGRAAARARPGLALRSE